MDFSDENLSSLHSDYKKTAIFRKHGSEAIVMIYFYPKEILRFAMIGQKIFWPIRKGFIYLF